MTRVMPAVEKAVVGAYQFASVISADVAEHAVGVDDIARPVGCRDDCDVTKRLAICRQFVRIRSANARGASVRWTRKSRHCYSRWESGQIGRASCRERG